MTKRKDITKYSENELSMIVFNEEGFYNIRHNRAVLVETLNSCFVYTANQLAVLKYDLMCDAEELDASLMAN